jgi:hypothetical protein
MDALQRAYDDRAEPEYDEELADTEAACDDAIAIIGRALRAMVTDKAAAVDLLREAVQLLNNIADEVVL